MNNIVVLKNVNYDIKDGCNVRKILNNVNYVFEKNKIYAISGVSGSGKTTLIHAIAGLIGDVCGKIIINGVDILDIDEDAKNEFRLNNISMIFQNLNLFEFLNVYENIVLPLRLKGKKIDSNVKNKVFEYMKLLNIYGTQQKDITLLSGGERQRVAILRSVICGAKIILCDEPTASIDYENTQIFMQMVNKIREEVSATFIIVTHDSKVMQYVDKNIYLLNGKLEERENE